MKRTLRCMKNEVAYGYEACLRHIKKRKVRFASYFAKQNASWRQIRRFIRAKASASFHLATPPLFCYNIPKVVMI